MRAKLWEYFLTVCFAFFCAACIFVVGVGVVGGIQVVYNSSYSQQAYYVLITVLGVIFLIGMIQAIVRLNKY